MTPNPPPPPPGAAAAPGLLLLSSSIIAHLVLLDLDPAALAVLARCCHALRTALADPVFKRDWVVRRLSAAQQPSLAPRLVYLSPAKSPPPTTQNHDDFFVQFPHTYRLRLPTAITADDGAMLLLLTRELALAPPVAAAASSAEAQGLLLKTRRDAILAIARYAFWNGLPQVANAFLFDRLLWERVKTVCDGVPPAPTRPRGPKKSQPNPWKYFRRACYVRGHTDLLRAMWANPPDPDVWGNLHTTWVGDLDCALRNKSCSLVPQQPILPLVWGLAQSTLPSTTNTALLVSAAFYAADLTSINFLRAHDVPYPVNDRRGTEQELAPWVSSALSGFSREIGQAIDRSTSAWLARDRSLAWITLWSHAATMPEVTGPTAVARVVHSILCRITKESDVLEPIFKCQIDVLKVLLAQNPPDALCARFIFKAALQIPQSLNVLDALALPFWPRPVVVSSAQQAFQEWARLSASNRAVQKWVTGFEDDITHFDSLDDLDKDDNRRSQPGWEASHTEMQHRWRTLHRLAHDALESSVDLKSPNSETMRKQVQTAYWPHDLKSEEGSFLAALVAVGETLRDDPTPFDEWLRRWSRSGGVWDARIAMAWIENLLKLGFDVEKITSDYEPWCEHHGVRLALLAKHGSTWARELLSGADLDQLLAEDYPLGVSHLYDRGTDPLERAPV
ncbi:hypothetical protein HDU88_000408 [Geranomyces variabilis]|nr:hypothetical protein HDU88_000408 [Geranomyces variabilis]